MNCTNLKSINGKWLISGFMASGKTTALKNISSKIDSLSIKLMDLDGEIEAIYKQSAASIFEAHGINEFRRRELNVFKNFIKKNKSFILSLGGGTLEGVGYDTARKEGCKIIWLDTPFELCLKRIRANADQRPLSKLKDEELKDLFLKRRVVYEKADYVICPMEGQDKLLEIISSDTI